MGASHELHQGTAKTDRRHGDVDVLEEAGSAAVLLWTSQKKFVGVDAQHHKELCSLVNAAIRDDHEDLASSTAEITRAINTTCVVRGQDMYEQCFPTDGITWRGSGFDDAHRPLFTAGKQCRVPGFLATSFSEEVATEFRDEWAFILPDGSRITWIVHSCRSGWPARHEQAVPACPFRFAFSRRW